MSDTLANIQTDIRFWTNDSLLDITTDATNLRVFNMAYRGLCTPDFEWLGQKVGRQIPERTRQDTSLTMIVGTGTYTWPTNPVFIDPVWIEGLDVNSSNEPYPIPWATDLATWSLYDESTNDTPLYCRLIDVSGTVKLELRPKPAQADPIRITGVIEVTELVNTTDTTIFRNRNFDKALVLMLAAFFKKKRGRSGEAVELMGMAKSFLPVNDTTPSLTGGGRIVPWRYGTRLWR